MLPRWAFAHTLTKSEGDLRKCFQSSTRSFAAKEFSVNSFFRSAYYLAPFGQPRRKLHLLSPRQLTRTMVFVIRIAAYERQSWPRTARLDRTLLPSISVPAQIQSVPFQRCQAYLKV